MDSNSSRGKRTSLQPLRAAGRQRVEELLEAASDLMAERGYEATTMAEIAARAGAKIGSLYRFFPNKEAVADALVQRHIAVLEDEYAALAKRAATLSPEALADVLIELLVTLYPRVKSLSALMEARTDRMEIRERARGHAIVGIAAALRVCAPGLGEMLAKDISAVVLNTMKVLRGMLSKDAPTMPGAPDELRRMHRLYLADRLEPFRRTLDSITEAEP
ncbi:MULTISPECIES: TetR/AcrR family transcriptional regulator [Acetobacteraceae]|uniref:TetR/AcrR family transcriptional regulator n=2 Tax=Acetobacteraceae TaxID=433 RepID=A0A939KR18_9PROT|nr:MULTISPECIES: TetR/AcrR family transcriptional regulator [Acetobacteraceae]MBO1326244.1 TetR/AcrR family transcriptional regulator [Acetobacter garciniae]MBX0346018.1 TetR/AcrR family transcriptional regulator [Acetobacter garciniae]GCE85070.1 transcriptional regulator [Komagataeibacter diospyri]GCE91372.1 transcriptional regulator [Komagataeibacter diospyri]